jgi:hypothetical protein
MVPDRPSGPCTEPSSDITKFVATSPPLWSRQPVQLDQLGLIDPESASVGPNQLHCQSSRQAQSAHGEEGKAQQWITAE